ncbi:sugar efflux transporter [Salinibius halmophilus]|uniref:sugar efflux transporter n=1 Tax=Salinibius halmophilus TaxID=1853216 RepID=UPI000E67184D|nr:sugar efflux transporter [Salinibius halmophilus]
MFNKHSILFMLSTTFAGLAFAFFHPLISLYLVDELGASPLAMGIYMAIVLGSGVLVSTYLGHRSDKGMARRPLVIAGQVGFTLLALTLIFTRDYWLALVAGIAFLSVSTCALPQLFTLGRTYADEKLDKEKGSTFIAFMRAGIAVAWVVGPPLAFMTKAQFGFNGALAIAAVTSLVVVAITLLLPEYAAQHHEDNRGPNMKSWQLTRPALLFLLATLAMFSALNMYSLNMPLYLTKVLEVSDQWVGNLMGIAAFVEVPVMIAIGALSVKFGSRPLLIIGVIAGGGFYFGLTQVDSIAALIALQLLNGIFVGITASLGISFMQDLMKHALGLATTLFSNAQTAAMLIGSFNAGLVANYFGYESVFWVCTLLIALALVLLLMVKPNSQTQPAAQS